MDILKWRGRTSKEAFADRFRAILQQQLPGASIEEIGELEFRVECSPQIGSRTVWLGRAYKEFCADPGQADAILSRWLATATAPTREGIELDRIIPVVKDRRWWDQQRTASGAGFDPWTEPYNAELLVIFAEYHNGLRFPHRSDFDNAGVPADELRQRALANLRQFIKEIRVHGKEGEYLLGAGGTIDSSLLLLDETMQDARMEFAGEPLVGVSDRDSFWVADDANPFAVFAIAARVARCYRTEPYPISKQLFRKVAGVWQPLDPAAEESEHPIPKLDVIDICGEKRDGGVDLVVIIASPLGADARSVFRLLTKLDGYLCEIESSQWKQQYPDATVEMTNIIVKLHADSDPMIATLLSANAGWVEDRGARLVIEELEV